MKLANQLYTALLNPESQQNLAYIQQALNKGELTIDEYFCEYEKNTVWHVLVKNPDLLHQALLQELLQYFSAQDEINREILKNVLNKKDVGGYTPLHHAAINKNFNAITLLVHFGADPTLADDHGHTPLFFIELSADINLNQKMRTLVKDYTQGIKPTVIFNENKLLKEEHVSNRKEKTTHSLKILVRNFFPWYKKRHERDYVELSLPSTVGHFSTDAPKVKYT